MLLDSSDTRLRRLTGRPGGGRRAAAAPTLVRALVPALARALLVLGGAGAVLLGAAGPAGAHNNRTVFVGERGPYDVVASVVDVDRGEETGLLLELNVRSAGDRRPVEDATVTVSGVAGSRRAGPLQAEAFAGTYRVLVPGLDVESWELEVTIDSARGEARFTEAVPGPVALHGIAVVDSGDEPATAGWVAVVVALVVGLAGAGLTGVWRTAVRGASAALLVAAAVVLHGTWSASSSEAAAKALAMLPAGAAAVALVVGAVLVGRGRDDAVGLVFAGAAGLAIVVGWPERTVLGDRYLGTSLSPGVARAGVAAVLGLGSGLAALVVVRSRTALRGLVPRRAG